MRRRGFTLLELLIVVGIMLAITAIAIPMLVPSQRERRMHEANREIQSAFMACRSRAVETGRPAGLILHRMEGLPEACIQISTAEMPLPYAGDFQTSRAFFEATVGPDAEWGRAFVDDDRNGTVDDILEAGFNGTDDGMLMDLPADAAWLYLVRNGDLIKFDYKGAAYRIEGAYDPADPLEYLITGSLPWTLHKTTSLEFPRADPTLGLPYQVFCRARPGVGQSIQLPETVVIDLDASTSGTQGAFSDMPGDITIMYMPGGRIETVSWGTIHGSTSMPLLFLLGVREALPAVAGQENWRDLRNSWVVVNPITGQASSKPVLLGPTPTLTESRQLAADLEGQAAR